MADLVYELGIGHNGELRVYAYTENLGIHTHIY